MSVKEFLNKFNYNTKYAFWTKNELGTENGASIENISAKSLGEGEKDFPTLDDAFLVKNMANLDILEKCYCSVLDKI